MIHVLLTVKPSVRFPGKNIRLARYTTAWLAQEIMHIGEQVRVYTVGWRSELPCNLPEKWSHIECCTGSHQGDIELAEQQIAADADDVFILAQFTQPLRRCGLLWDVAALARRRGCAVTACEARQDDWRKLRNGGRWSSRKRRRAKLIDGALYGWTPGNVSSVFNADAEHGTILNYEGQPVDVDINADIPGALPGAWAELMLSAQK